MPKENKKVKNSVLIDLFYEDESAERNQISLYNALHEKPLPDGTKIMPLRVENIIYMNFQNDFSYEVDGKTPLELEVKVININPEAQHELLEKCQVMKEYGIFIDTIRKYQTEDIEDPYELAIKECIKKGILADYLSKKGSEVINMLQAEYDYELDIEVQREEAYEDGLRAGEQTEKILLIIKKVRRGKSLQTIADELEEPVDEVRKIYEAVMKAAPDYDIKMIRESLA